ncbi:MAG: ATP-binding cassette domain-containing protein [Anaerolineales bacterium]
MSVIEINHLTKYYGKARGIIDVTLNIEEGEIFGFIGPNGAGKSTTIRLLCSLIYPTSGEAKIFGKDCIKYGPEIRQEIGYLPSEVFYYDRMKVIDLLKYSASDLSYGNKKKVGIVQGLLHSPKVIFLDEPTAGLDPLIQHKFFDLIRDENKKGATVFFSSHILSVVQKICNRVAIIREGKIVEIKDIKTLQRENYKKITIVADGVDGAGFQIPGVTHLETQNNSVSFFFKGDINVLTKKIAALKVNDVAIEEPTLEEIFMHYYE